MTGYYKIVCSILVAVLIFVSIVASRPAPEHSKIRIHVPVKHHTHIHTKTIIKEVHVPVKHHEYHHEPIHKPSKYNHRVTAFDDDDDDDEIIRPHKSHLKKKKFHPFIKK